MGPKPQLSVRLDIFERIIEHVSEHFTPLGLPELVKGMIAGQTLPERAAVVTFDDGYRDNWSTAYPILVKYNVPATIYITTGFVDKIAYPYEFQLASWIKERKRMQFEWRGRNYHWNLEGTAAQEDCYRTIKALTKPMHPEEREQVLRRVYGGDFPATRDDLFMDWEQVIELDRSPLITIGAHTHRHLLLTKLSKSEVAAEVETSKEILERRLDHPIKHFSYPYGAFNEEVRQIVQDLGFVTAVTTRSEKISKGDDLLAIPRIEASGEGPVEDLLGTL
jgi:peptidoglycan/xylan/chitin deacetylase (PgdA/CDA1 family)